MFGVNRPRDDLLRTEVLEERETAQAPSVSQGFVLKLSLLIYALCLQLNLLVYTPFYSSN